MCSVNGLELCVCGAEPGAEAEGNVGSFSLSMSIPASSSIAAVTSSTGLPNSPIPPLRTVREERIRASGPSSSLIMRKAEDISSDSKTLTCIHPHGSNGTHLQMRRNLVMRDYHQAWQVAFG